MKIGTSGVNMALYTEKAHMEYQMAIVTKATLTNRILIICPQDSTPE